LKGQKTQDKPVRGYMKYQSANCSAGETSVTCVGHFERAAGESRNLFFNGFLRFATLRVAPVEMTGD
jgi:hypothetical protein